MGVSLSLLPSLFDAADAQSGGAGLLQILYGRGQSSGSVGNQPIAALKQAEANQARDIQTTAAKPDVQRALGKFVAAVKGATTVQQLLRDPAVLDVLLTANGLGNQTQYPALAQKALLSDLGDAESLANKLTDTRWKAAAKTYDFANQGLSVIQQPQVIATITNAYAEVVWRKSLDDATPGLSNALTFRAQAAGIGSVDQILGDSVLRTVVTTALGIPQQIAFQPLQAQETAISSRLDLSKLKDPHFVEAFTQRYLLAAGQAAAGSAGAATNDLTSLAVQSQGLVV